MKKKHFHRPMRVEQLESRLLLAADDLIFDVRQVLDLLDE